MVGMVRNEVIRVADVDSRVRTLDQATVTVNQSEHEGRINSFSRLAGVTVTLPLATGSGAVYFFMVGIVATSNQHRIDAAGSDTFEGNAIQLADGGNTLAAYEGNGDTQFNYNGTTTGGSAIGDWVKFTDIVSAVWAVEAVGAATGSEATPFTA